MSDVNRTAFNGGIREAKPTCLCLHPGLQQAGWFFLTVSPWVLNNALGNNGPCSGFYTSCSQLSSLCLPVCLCVVVKVEIKGCRAKRECKGWFTIFVFPISMGATFPYHKCLLYFLSILYCLLQNT